MNEKPEEKKIHVVSVNVHTRNEGLAAHAYGDLAEAGSKLLTMLGSDLTQVNVSKNSYTDTEWERL